jgi:hypothetical protein
MAKKKKLKKPKPRIPVAPPGIRHKSIKDYDRKKEKKEVKKLITEGEWRKKL